MTLPVKASVIKQVGLRDCTGNARTSQSIHEACTSVDPEVSQLLVSELDFRIRIATVRDAEQAELVERQFRSCSYVGGLVQKAVRRHDPGVQLSGLEPAGNRRDGSGVWLHDLVVVVGHGAGGSNDDSGGYADGGQREVDAFTSYRVKGHGRVGIESPHDLAEWVGTRKGVNTQHQVIGVEPLATRQGTVQRTDCRYKVLITKVSSDKGTREPMTD